MNKNVIRRIKQGGFRYEICLMHELHLFTILSLKQGCLTGIFISLVRQPLVFYGIRNPVSSAAAEADSATAMSGISRYASTTATAVPTSAVVKFPVA